VFEVYTRKVAGNEFELNINYDGGESKSRLHPTLRVYLVIVKFDRPQPLRQVLRTSPDIALLCHDGCRLQKDGTTDSIFITDTALTESLFFEYWSENGESRTLGGMDDPVSRISIENYFQPPDGSTDIGAWRTPVSK
jgi:hypothetical protein